MICVNLCQSSKDLGWTEDRKSFSKTERILPSRECLDLNYHVGLPCESCNPNLHDNISQSLKEVSSSSFGSASFKNIGVPLFKQKKRRDVKVKATAPLRDCTKKALGLVFSAGENRAQFALLMYLNGSYVLPPLRYYVSKCTSL